MQFKQPPVIKNEKGNLRTVGFELEFSNLSIEKSVQVIQELYGGKQEIVNRFYQKVVGSHLGDFTVEFDLVLLTEKGYKKLFEKLNIKVENVKFGARTLAEGIESALEKTVGKLFPFEIACPPVPINQLEEIEKLRESLFRHHAHDTKSSFVNAYGTHINIEVPVADTDTIIRYLRAFLLLYPWLIEIGHTDFARRMSPFIDPYPDDYVLLILNPGYNPDLETLIDDYNLFNPNRNRPIDMYPLFAFLKEDIIKKYPDIGKVKPRNTFHYRLPNSSISDPDWSLAKEWNNWVVIEELANDPEKIQQMSKEYISLRDVTYIGFDSKWTKRTLKWIN